MKNERLLPRSTRESRRHRIQVALELASRLNLLRFSEAEMCTVLLSEILADRSLPPQAIRVPPPNDMTDY